MENHGIIEVVLPRVIAEDGEDDECHLVHQMLLITDFVSLYFTLFKMIESEKQHG